MVLIRVVLCLLVLFHVAYGQTTIRIASYNLLKFGASDTDRVPALTTVISAIDPDVLVVQELSSEEGYNLFLNQVMKQIHDDYKAAPYMNGRDTDNGLFYRTSRVELAKTDTVSIGLRPMSRYDLEALGQQFSVYGVHLKASSGRRNEERRAEQANIIRRHLNDRTAGDNFILAGDFNLYKSDEPAFALLTGPQADNDGRLFDPIDTSGKWHDRREFAAVHTQSPRKTQFGGGASGGLDDRFDFMLVSATLLDSSGLDIQVDTYTALGNDRDHFNRAINDGNNTAVSRAIANALHSASDHLPVYADFVIGSLSASPEYLVEWTDNIDGIAAILDSLNNQNWELYKVAAAPESYSVIFYRSPGSSSQIEFEFHLLEDENEVQNFLGRSAYLSPWHSPEIVYTGRSYGVILWKHK